MNIIKPKIILSKITYNELHEDISTFIVDTKVNSLNQLNCLLFANRWYDDNIGSYIQYVRIYTRINEYDLRMLNDRQNVRIYDI